MKTIIGETWKAVLTDEEYQDWIKYDESHPWLASQLPMENILKMFLGEYRRGNNLNLKSNK